MTNETPTQSPQAPEPQKVPGLFPAWLGAAGRFLLEIIEVVLISLAIILPIRYFLIQPFYVKGASMEPTFEDREYLIIDELSYRMRAPERGEVIVFRYPLDPRQYFIKRVIGLPGDTVKIANDTVTIVDAANPKGFTLDETSYLSPTVPTLGNVNVTLGPSDYFVMGDNRTSSLDSRSFGLLPRQNVIGRVWIRGWPVARFTVFQPPVAPPHS